MKQKRDNKRFTLIDVNKVMRFWEQINDLLMTTNPLSWQESYNCRIMPECLYSSIYELTQITSSNKVV